uniref:Uncharacterized protein n=1 Tax=Rhipicephalus zambeziensis TaxID=60191 RepID=A0A224YM03_9ACAR
MPLSPAAYLPKALSCAALDSSFNLVRNIAILCVVDEAQCLGHWVDSYLLNLKKITEQPGDSTSKQKRRRTTSISFLSTSCLGHLKDVPEKYSGECH